MHNAILLTVRLLTQVFTVLVATRIERLWESIFLTGFFFHFLPRSPPLRLIATDEILHADKILHAGAM